MQEIYIRKLEAEDVTQLASLVGELGYESDVELVKKQVDSILSGQDNSIYVAECENNIVGYIQCFVTVRLTSPTFVEIGGLVVSEQYRRKGIGTKLVNHASQSFIEIGAIRVRCNVKRPAAHEFYKRLNFSENKVQQVFVKSLRGVES